jgi:bifunctional UDP-N-acetylglucosamine pyrophosphorylase/glucosamine-1-phosphate N-acetyltransferase
MNSDLPKPLHELGGRPLVAHALATGRALDPERVIVVTGHGAEEVEAAVAEADPAICVRQEAQNGTGHAVLQAAPALQGFEGDAVVLYADTPFLTPETLDRLRAARADHDVVVLGFDAEDPGTLRSAGDGGRRADADRGVQGRHARRMRDHRLQFRCDGRRCRDR